MKALSIQQPWAYAILHLGKDFENRTWGTRHRGSLLIHTGKKFDQDGLEYLIDEMGFGLSLPGHSAKDFKLGGIVGEANLTSCGELNEDDQPPSDWAFGPWIWQLTNPRVLDFTPLRGQMGLFDVQMKT